MRCWLSATGNGPASWTFLGAWLGDRVVPLGVSDVFIKKHEWCVLLKRSQPPPRTGHGHRAHTACPWTQSFVLPGVSGVVDIGSVPLPLRNKLCTEKNVGYVTDNAVFLLAEIPHFDCYEQISVIFGGILIPCCRLCPLQTFYPVMNIEAVLKSTITRNCQYFRWKNQIQQIFICSEICWYEQNIIQNASRSCYEY